MDRILIVLREGLGLNFEAMRPALQVGAPIAIGRGGAVIAEVLDDFPEVREALGEIGADGWRKLGRPAQVGGVIFSPNLSSRLVVEAAQRHHEYSQQPEVEAERLQRLRDLLELVHAAPSQPDPTHHQLVHKISAFALELIRGAGEGGSFDGGCIQDLAVKHGLMTIEECEEPCSDEGCACAQYGFPIQCYRIKLEVLAIEQIAKAQGENLSQRQIPGAIHE